MAKIYKLIDILKYSTDYLEKANVDSPRLTAEYIIATILDLKRIDLYMNYDKPLSTIEREKIKKNLIRRAKDREPLQYIMEYEEFYGLKFYVDKNVLIPRPETEILVENAIKYLEKIEEPKILEIGVGSGAISISIGKNLINSKIIGVDISEGALKIAEKNRENLGLNNVRFVKSDIFENINYKSFDLIISNPPYISEEEYSGLMPEVKNYEPKLALVAKEDGNYFYRTIIENGKNYLKNGGKIFFEVGYNQSKIVKELFIKNRYKNIEILKDYGKIERILIGEK
ncbi:peptide chain release factor N(5)-glutamine methyltransferase [Haliovirga abyssi]|uniref:Release factor glutamine methyltransferase n=1 Tax=Haliovirga abyssi TaxID=2996794 RepID=A0AAU9DK45_9FUSO|nr:peptide chain release factor N(5)-glutamine methyltransferase [Haliovirga abyssi]BDU50247.1 release factor glutamine methyltransferase [Haliovirga abyssi]